jgi:hypothetical protein
MRTVQPGHLYPSRRSDSFPTTINIAAARSPLTLLLLLLRRHSYDVFQYEIESRDEYDNIK